MPVATQTRFDKVFTERELPTPCLMIDLDVVADRYRELRSALPEAEIYYAVKANPHPEVISCLAALGACFDVASSAEIDICLDAGADPAKLSYGNTIKRAEDISYAAERGITMFAFDSENELRKIAAAAPGAAVFCRLLVSGKGALWPLSRKFGCDDSMAANLLVLALDCGLMPIGVSFHVGSQQLDPTRWEEGVALAAKVGAALRDRGQPMTVLNLGGGFPARYSPGVPHIDEYAKAIRTALDEHGLSGLRTVVEPGRYLAGDAGVLRSRIVLVSRKSDEDNRRWIYLDAGRFGGLAETENEAIRYPLATTKDGTGPTGPVTLAGPTCDSQDILYERNPRYLPMELNEGDFIDFLSAGAYTATYSSVGFNGFPPLPTYCFGGES